MNGAEAYLTTRYDDPPPTLPVPGSVGRGDDPALAVVDGLVRGRGAVGRWAGPAGLCGLRVESPDQVLQVTVSLALDRAAADWSPHRSWRHLPRLLLVRLTGGGARGVLLGPGCRAAGPVRARVRVPVPAGAVPAGGLLVVDVCDGAARLPDGTAAAFHPGGPAGVQVERLDVAPQPAVPPAVTTRVDGRTAEWSGLVSAGGVAAGTHTAGGPCLVVNPVADGPSAYRLRGRLLPAPARSAADPAYGAPAGVHRWRAAAGALRRALPARRRRLAPGEWEVRAWCLGTGVAVPVESAADGADRVVSFPRPPDAPLLLGAVPRRPPPRGTRVVVTLVECGTP
ncbi:MAG TPA: hypothetical protein VFY17_02430 [Pilimelia sp.]|nr:hypothetical protein [Pilimelia sp.]